VEISRLQRKEKYLKNTKTTAKSQIIGNYFVVFQFFSFSQSLEISTPNRVFQ
jgi:hypothetical protein